MSEAEKARKSYPQRAEFYCAPFGDGDGHQIKIGYDAAQGRFSDHVLIDDYNITFEERYAEEVCDAIMQSAAAIRALKNKKLSDE